MFQRLISVCAAAALFACAGGQKSGSASTTERQKLTNVVPFDVGVCFPREIEAPKNANATVLAGLWFAAQPRVNECLVDPVNRGSAKDTVVNVKVTLDDSGVKHEITGDNVSPAGQKCISDVIDAGFKVAALGSNAKPVVLTQKIEHQVGREPAVQSGISEISDVAAAIRLSLPKSCECFTAWKDAPPHELKLALTVHKQGGGQNDIKAVPTQDATADGVGACLQQKLVALALPVKSDTLNLPGLPLLFTNTSLDKDLSADQPASLRVMQLDGLRAQRNADSAVTAGMAANASTTYANLVNKYKANTKSVKVAELQTKCKALLSADDSYLKTLDAQIDVDQRTLALATSLKAQDAQWGDLEAGAQKQVQQSQAELQKAKSIRGRDSDACPKERY